MKDLNKLIIKNFQSHKETTVLFSPSITTFVGPSDNGKTAIFRALKLVLKNEPRGTGFITNGETMMSVTVGFTDKTEVTRERSKSVNRYILYEKDKEETKFEDFGIHIPLEIIQATNYKEIQIDPELSVDLNFAEQLEAPFLIGQADSVKAKVLDGLAKINVFNRALKNSNSKITSLRTEERNIDARLLEINNELINYENIEELKEKIDTIKLTIDTLKELNAKKQRFISLSERYDRLNTEINNTKYIVKGLSSIRECEKFYLEVLRLQDTINQYYNLFERLENIETNLVTTRNIVTQLKNISIAEKLYIEANNSLVKRDRLELLYKKYQNVNEEIDKCKEILKHKENILRADMLMFEIQDSIQTRKEMLKLGTQYFNTIKEIDKIKTSVERLKGINQVEVMYNEIRSLMQLKEKLINLEGQYNQCIVSINKGTDYVHSLKQKIEQEKETYKEALHQFNRCPVCFSELSNEHVDHIIKNL